MKRVQILYESGVIDQDIYHVCNEIKLLLSEKESLIITEDTPFYTHLAMALKRARAKEEIAPLEAQVVQELKSLDVYAKATDITKKIEQYTEGRLTPNEIDYVSLHLCNILGAQPKKQRLVPGYTLIHEHPTIDLSGINQDQDCHLDCFDETLKQFKLLYEYGVRNIIDVTTVGMGRSIHYIEKLANLSGIQILSSTGFYKEPFLPQEVYDYDSNSLAEYMIHELTNGIENTNKKAFLIGEIGTSLHTMTALEKKVFDAAILAHQATHCVISTHTTLATYAIEQADYLIRHGVDPKKIIIGHQDLSGDIDQIKTLIRMGVYVGFDTIGKNNYFPDEKRAEFLYELQEEGYIHHIGLSMDITRKSNVYDLGYDYIFKTFIPMLLKHGVTQASIDTMLIHNPQRLFT